jgi:hypothetical protein
MQAAGWRHSVDAKMVGRHSASLTMCFCRAARYTSGQPTSVLTGECSGRREGWFVGLAGEHGVHKDGLPKLLFDGGAQRDVAALDAPRRQQPPRHRAHNLLRPRQRHQRADDGCVQLGQRTWPSRGWALDVHLQSNCSACMCKAEQHHPVCLSTHLRALLVDNEDHKERLPVRPKRTAMRGTKNGCLYDQKEL